MSRGATSWLRLLLELHDPPAVGEIWTEIKEMPNASRVPRRTIIQVRKKKKAPYKSGPVFFFVLSLSAFLYVKKKRY